jgi:hypothetical protein
LAVKTGGIEAATRVICELDAERAKIERRLASGSPAPDLNTLRQVIEDRCQVDVVAGEGFARLRNEASSLTPDLRVMRKFQRFWKS